MNRKQKGELAKLKVELRANDKGVVVSRPTTEARYDLILDFGGTLKRAQVKYAGRALSHAIGSVSADLRSRNGVRKRATRSYSADEIDLLFVYVPQLDEVLLFEPDMFSGRESIAIRIKAPRNGQQKGITLATDHIW